MSNYSVDGRAVLLTGASSGIGHQLARRLGARGARLAIAARRVPELNALAAEIAAAGGHRPVVLPADLSTRGAAADLGERAQEAIGRIEVLINNAGGGVGGSQWAVADGDPAREAFEVNLWSPLALIGLLVPPMRDCSDGVVVNVTSAAQTVTWPCFGTYAATKAALGLATETLRLELMNSGVHVVEVIPGPVDTAVQGETRLIPGIDRLLKPLGMGDPDTAARRIVTAIEQRQARVVYPAAATVGLALPTLGRRRARRLVAKTFATVPADDREALLSLAIRSGSAGDPAVQEARKAWETSS
jgi:short-subunit dehydrogenase